MVFVEHGYTEEINLYLYSDSHYMVDLEAIEKQDHYLDINPYHNDPD